MTPAQRQSSVFEALIPIIFLVILLAANVAVFGSDATYGPNQIALLLAGSIAAAVAMRLGYTWVSLRKGVVESISSAMSAILILLMIGALAGTWLLSGIVPAMIYYGLEVLNPTIFLVAACIISAVVSLATGSSWSTIATVGIALLGIGSTLGIDEGMAAGAIISGAYFGDKMSPLSDTTNLAPAMAGTDLFTHIRYMTLTTIPSIALTLVIFLVMGFTIETGEAGTSTIEAVQLVISSQFDLNPIIFLVPILVIGLIVKKVPALPALFLGTIAGGVAAIIFQQELIFQIAGESENIFKASYTAIMRAMFDTISVPVNSDILIDLIPDEKARQDLAKNLADLLKAKGMSGMMNTIWLILCAMVFGGIMEKSGLLQRLTSGIVRAAQSTGALISATAGTCFFFNLTASDQYLAIVVPGRMYADTYAKRGLAPENLSRTLEDSGTVTSVLIPWNTCGAAQSTVLSVATGTYLPYCFFNIISPLMTMTFAYLNIKIRRITPSETAKTEE